MGPAVLYIKSREKLRFLVILYEMEKIYAFAKQAKTVPLLFKLNDITHLGQPIINFSID